jgi:16S rRNA (guanine966-N2)-methyltransferase
LEKNRLLRIISGKVKGKKLHTFSGKAIRPTSDRIREAVFSILANHFKGAVVLDLFAGSGALGIEALSRGAETATFIDNATISISLIKKNLLSCRLDEQARVIQWDIEKNLNCLAGGKLVFDLVFMDPPYDKSLISPALNNLYTSKSIKRDSTIIIEQDGAKGVQYDNAKFALKDQRKYGKTLVSFLTTMV